MTKIVEKAIKEMFLEIPPEMQPHIAMPQLQMSSSPLQQQQQQQQQPSTNHIVYNGKIINIEMGDAMITISPNIFKSRRARSSASSVYHTPPASPKIRAGVKTRRKKNGKKDRRRK
jgi:hypothetical protein